MLSDHYYTELAAAYVRGVRPELAGSDDAGTLEAAARAGLRLHRFKRTAGLPRVRRVLGALKGFAPASLLDIGSGRGAFLWPLLDELPDLRVTAVDLLPYRVRDIAAVRRGGVDRLEAVVARGEALPWAGARFDAVTVLEVLEHVADPGRVASEALRVAGAVVLATVPSREDDNPEHIRCFTGDTLTALFAERGASNVRIEYVLNHIVAVVTP